MHLREARDWSQAELARRVGVERTTLLRWERGATPPLGKLLALSQVLETTLDALIAGRTVDLAPESLTPEQRREAAGHLNQIASLLGLRTGQSKRPTSPPS
jgi:transcriptional regulator with XRE-family HTH domain